MVSTRLNLPESFPKESGARETNSYRAQSGSSAAQSGEFGCTLGAIGLVINYPSRLKKKCWKSIMDSAFRMCRLLLILLCHKLMEVEAGKSLLLFLLIKSVCTWLLYDNLLIHRLLL